MTLYRYLKENGFDSVAKFSELSKIPQRTLRDWFAKSNFEKLDYYIDRVKSEQEKGKRKKRKVS